MRSVIVCFSSPFIASLALSAIWPTWRVAFALADWHRDVLISTLKVCVNFKSASKFHKWIYQHHQCAFLFRILMIISCINNRALKIERNEWKSFASFVLSMCEKRHSFLILLVWRPTANDGVLKNVWSWSFGHDNLYSKAKMNFIPSIKLNYYRFENLIFLVEKRNVHFSTENHDFTKTLTCLNVPWFFHRLLAFHITLPLINLPVKINLKKSD